MLDEPVAAEEEALGEAAEEEVEGLVEERAALEDEAPGEDDEGLVEERAALEDEAPGEDDDGLVEERAALEEAAGAFLERLLEEKRVNMLA